MEPRTVPPTRTASSGGFRHLAATAGHWLMVATGVLALLGVLGRFTGVHLAGPNDASAQITARVDSTVGRITSLERTVNGQGEQLRDLQEGVRLTNYIQCVELRRSDPAAVPPGCDIYTAQARRSP